MVYAIDFDGTLCKDEYPNIGKAYNQRIESVKRLQQAGNKIILWTSRNGKDLTEAVSWCKQRGLIFDSVNENLPEVQAKWGGDTRKIFCDFYIDDKNLPTKFLDF